MVTVVFAHYRGINLRWYGKTNKFCTCKYRVTDKQSASRIKHSGISYKSSFPSSILRKSRTWENSFQKSLLWRCPHSCTCYLTRSADYEYTRSKVVKKVWPLQASITWVRKKFLKIETCHRLVAMLTRSPRALQGEKRGKIVENSSHFSHAQKLWFLKVPLGSERVNEIFWIIINQNKCSIALEKLLYL